MNSIKLRRHIMSKKYLTILTVISALVIAAGAANAYPQNTLFGTGYGFAGYNNFGDGVNESHAINAKKQFVETTTTEANDEFAEGIKKVSDVARDHDEAPNAGYKTTYTYIEKDMSDYNPYTGADSGVNDSKSIYTDGLGRLHFFGKGSLFRHKD